MTVDLTQEILKRADAISAWASGGVDKIGEGVGKIAPIAYEQAIDIAKQYIMFGCVYQTTLMILSVLMLIPAYLFCKNGVKWIER